MKKAVITDKAPKAIGPYSQGIIFGDLVFVSGQIPLNPATGEMASGSIEEQAHRAFQNVAAILEAADSGLSNVLKVTIFLKNMGEFAKINEVYTEYFKEIFPARAVAEAARLPKDASIMVEAIAYR